MDKFGQKVKGVNFWYFETRPKTAYLGLKTVFRLVCKILRKIDLEKSSKNGQIWAKSNFKEGS